MMMDRYLYAEDDGFWVDTTKPCGDFAEELFMEVDVGKELNALSTALFTAESALDASRAEAAGYRAALEDAQTMLRHIYGRGRIEAPLRIEVIEVFDCVTSTLSQPSAYAERVKALLGRCRDELTPRCIDCPVTNRPDGCEGVCTLYPLTLQLAEVLREYDAKVGAALAAPEEPQP